MLALQAIPGFGVVESIASGGPGQDFEIPAEVFRVAADATVVAAVRPGDACMISPVHGNSIPNLCVAVRAPELGPTEAEGVATGALQDAVQVRVRLRQGAGRQLGFGRGTEPGGQNQSPQHQSPAAPESVLWVHEVHSVDCAAGTTELSVIKSHFPEWPEPEGAASENYGLSGV